MTQTVTRLITTGTSHVPAQAHQSTYDAVSTWATCRPRNITASTTPITISSRPSRCPGRWCST
jgi:hypothetical protein